MTQKQLDKFIEIVLPIMCLVLAYLDKQGGGFFAFLAGCCIGK